MDKNNIQSIEVVNGTDSTNYSIREDRVKIILDKSIEFENSLHTIFSIIGYNDKEIAEVINCPVIVRYK